MVSLAITLMPIASSLQAQNWNEIKKLKASDVQKNALLGYTLAINGNTAAVGANGIGNGKVYIYERQSNGDWVETQIIEAEDGKNMDQFGSSISLSDNMLVIGAIWVDVKIEGLTFQDAGAAYVFKKANDKWVQKAKLLAKDPGKEDQFGISVSQSGSQVLVGAIWNDYNTEGKKLRPDAGAVYVFEENSGKWIQKQKIVPEGRKAYDLFGISVQADGNKAVFGAYRNGFNEKDKSYLEFSGAAYYFEKDANGLWQEKQKLVANDRSEGAFFGYSVSLKNDVLVIGSQEMDKDINGTNELEGSGAAYIFSLKEGIWTQSQKITADDRYKFAYFGESVFTDGNKIVVGAWGQPLDAQELNPIDTAGAAYLFEKNGDSWKQTSKLVSSQRHQGDQFGISVAVDGKHIIAGSWGNDIAGNDTVLWSGSAHIFADCQVPSLTVSASDQMIQEGDQVILDAKGADDIKWDNGVINGVSFQPEKTAVYRVIGRNSDGCFAEDEIEVFVRAKVIEEITVKASAPVVRELSRKDKENFQILSLSDKQIAANTSQMIEDVKGMTVISNLKYENSEEPIANVGVLLMDENGFVLKRGRTDANGIARFEMLDPDREYEVRIDKNDPEVETKIMKSGQQISLKKQEFMNTKMGGYALLSQIAYSESEAPAADVYVLLIDEKGNVLKKGRTDAEGVALFEELENHQNYQVIIDKNHPSLDVDVKHQGQVISIDSEKVLENFKRLAVLSKLSYADSDEPAIGVPVALLDENGVVLKKGVTNDEGLASFMMPELSDKYVIVIDKEQLMKEGAQETGDQMKLDNIYFDFNSHSVREESEIVLKDLSDLLKKHPNMKLAIHAHTDALGTDDINFALAKKRGEEVKTQLILMGIPSDRISVNAVGDDMPIASNDKDLGRQLNRRVEFELLN